MDTKQTILTAIGELTKRATESAEQFEHIVNEKNLIINWCSIRGAADGDSVQPNSVVISYSRTEKIIRTQILPGIEHFGVYYDSDYDYEEGCAHFTDKDGFFKKDYEKALMKLVSALEANVVVKEQGDAQKALDKVFPGVFDNALFGDKEEVI